MCGKINSRRDSHDGQFLANKLFLLRPIKQPIRVACCGRQQCQQSYDTSFYLANAMLYGNRIKWNSVYCYL